MVAEKNINRYIDKFNELKTIFDSLPDGIVAILDDRMNIATANKAISEFLGIPLSKIIGKNSNKLFEDRIPGLGKLLKDSYTHKQSIRNFSIEFISQASEVKSFLVSTAVLDTGKNKNSGIVLILHDVTEMSFLRKIAQHVDRYGEVIGKSEKMKKIYQFIDTIKDYDTSILIVGETGTGKEIVARAIHNASNRRDKPFVPVSCSALPDNLIESELFGHVRGAFTGASSEHKGRFQLANGGTLFLDEIGTLNLSTQVKLLRVLQEKIVEPLGSDKRIPIDVRIISATNRDLLELVAKNEFREDLFYRLKVMRIDLPPLRERKEDIPLLVEHFIRRLNHVYHKNIVGLSPEAEKLLNNYLWPGNVRELENAIEHAFVLATGSMLEKEHFPPEIRFADTNGAPPPPTEVDLSDQEERIKRALMASKGNKSKAAELLGMHRTSLWRLMREYGIAKDFGKAPKSSK